MADIGSGLGRQFWGQWQVGECSPMRAVLALAIVAIQECGPKVVSSPSFSGEAVIQDMYAKHPEF